MTPTLTKNLRYILGEQIPEVKATDKLGDLGLDSFDLQEMVLVVEKEFDVELDLDYTFKKNQTISDVIEVINNKKSGVNTW